MAALAELAAAHEDSLTHPVGPLHISDRVFDVDAGPILMGTVNLSRDSTYRESVAVSQESAVRKARVMAAEGAALIDIGAESSTARAVRVDAQQQSDLLLPVIEQLVKDDILVSVETYEPLVVEAAPLEGYRAWHGGMSLSRHLSGDALEMGYEYMNWWLSGWAGAVMARQGYYISNPLRAKDFLAPEEWAYWYEGAAAATATKKGPPLRTDPRRGAPGRIRTCAPASGGRCSIP